MSDEGNIRAGLLAVAGGNDGHGALASHVCSIRYALYGL